MAYPTVDPQPSFPALEERGPRLLGGRRAPSRRRSTPARPARTAPTSSSSTTGRRSPTACRTTATCSPATSRTRCRATRRCAAGGSSAASAGTATACPPRSRPRSELGIVRARRRSPSTASTAFNDACRTSVLRYTDEWERYVTRQARWVDFDNDYKTLDLPYMESVMWAFKTAVGQGPDLRGLPGAGRTAGGARRRCRNTETRMDDVYRDRQDPALTVWFAAATTGASASCAWTTTPWTLPSNLALAVGPDIDYAVMEEDGAALRARRGARSAAYERELADATRVGTRQGRELVGRRYTPLFPFFADQPNAFQVLAADFVSTEDGTGVVHMAPGLRRGRPERLQRRRHRRPSCPMDAHGRFTAEVAAVGRRARVRRQPATSSAALKDARPSSCATRPTTTPTRTAGAAPSRSSTGPCRRGSSQVTAFRDRMVELNQQITLGARARQGRQLRQVAGQRPRLVDQPQPLLGLADPGVEAATTRATRASTSTAASTSSSATSACASTDLHRPMRRRARAAQPRRPDRPVDDAARARGARLLVRVGLDAVRPGALPVRERRRGSRTTTRATSSSSTSARPAAGSTRCTCWPPRCSTGRRSAPA